jgi:hypothetical protein
VGCALPFVLVKSIKAERFQLSAALAFDPCSLKRGTPHFVLFEELKLCAHHVARR